MYAANDTFDDGRDEDTSQNNVVTNKSKDKQVLKTYLKSKLYLKLFSMNTIFGRTYFRNISQHHIYTYKNFLSGLFKGNENSAILKCNYVKCIYNCYNEINVIKTKFD